MQANANRQQILGAIDHPRLCGCRLEPVVDRADTDGKTKHVAQQLYHPWPGTAADQGQGQYQLFQPLRRYRQVEQDIGVVICERLINCLLCLVLLPVNELSAESLLVSQLRDLCDLCQRQEGKALALVGWHIGCNARGILHLTPVSLHGKCNECQPWLAHWDLMKSVTQF